MKFKKQELQDLVYDDNLENFKKISDDMFGKSRWAISHRMVFQFENKFYEVKYRKASTECQEEKPFENDPEEIFCKEVFPKEVLVTIYE